MTFTIERGDALTTDDAALMHGVNCVGVMGGGIALPIKRMYPDNYEAYSRACIDKTLVPGGVLAVQDRGKWIINAASQYYVGSDARMEWLITALTNARSWAEMNGVPSITAPLIGGGIGGLDAQECVTVMRAAFEDSPVALRLVLRHGEHEDVV